jgi:hypothetical protein
VLCLLYIKNVLYDFLSLRTLSFSTHSYLGAGTHILFDRIIHSVYDDPHGQECADYSLGDVEAGYQAE